VILVAVWWLVNTGEMEAYLHTFLSKARVVVERWASRAGFFTPGKNWQVSGGYKVPCWICLIWFLQ
jgi:hypothetical protein